MLVWSRRKDSTQREGPKRYVHIYVCFVEEAWKMPGIGTRFTPLAVPPHRRSPANPSTIAIVLLSWELPPVPVPRPPLIGCLWRSYSFCTKSAKVCHDSLSFGMSGSCGQNAATTPTMFYHYRTDMWNQTRVLGIESMKTAGYRLADDHIMLRTNEDPQTFAIRIRSALTWDFPSLEFRRRRRGQLCLLCHGELGLAFF